LHGTASRWQKQPFPSQSIEVEGRIGCDCVVNHKWYAAMAVMNTLGVARLKGIKAA
jgi:hypothetical protein